MYRDILTTDNDACNSECSEADCDWREIFYDTMHPSWPKLGENEKVNFWGDSIE